MLHQGSAQVDYLLDRYVDGALGLVMPPRAQVGSKTSGVIQNVACPHCGVPQDLAAVFDKADEVDDAAHAVGAILSCDTCRHRYEVRRVWEETHVLVEGIADR